MLKPWVLLLGLGACELAGPDDFYLTPLDGQNLPGYLPSGWSPVAGLYYTASGSLAHYPQVTFTLPAPLPSPYLLWARWDEPQAQWLSVGTATVTAPAALYPEVTVTLGEPGGYVLLLPDASPAAPPGPAQGRRYLAWQRCPT